MMQEPECSKRNCANFLGFVDPSGQGNEGVLPVCKAFPNGIPPAIAWGNNKHIKPYPGDQGIRFEPIEPSDQ